MKGFLQFIKTTVLGGLIFLVPLIALAVLLTKALQFAAKTLHPVADVIPAPPVIGFAMADMLAVVALVAVGFIAGLLARTGPGRQLQERAEDVILRKVPGYTLLKGMSQGNLGPASRPGVTVALATVDDAWLFAFIMEEHDDGTLTVFVPSAPTPTAGTLYPMTERQVRRLNVSVSSAVKCIMQLGVGSRELLRNAAPVRTPRADAGWAIGPHTT